MLFYLGGFFFSILFSQIVLGLGLISHAHFIHTDSLKKSILLFVSLLNNFFSSANSDVYSTSSQIKEWSSFFESKFCPNLHSVDFSSLLFILSEKIFSCVAIWQSVFSQFFPSSSKGVFLVTANRVFNGPTGHSISSFARATSSALLYSLCLLHS